MQQVAQNYRSGELAVLDVPAPACLPGGVLVRTLYSLISTGTEMMKVSESKMSLLNKARSRPEQVAKVLETAAQQGPLNAYKKAMNRLDSYTPLGYSLAGVVIEVGRGAEEFSVGQLVACAGNEFALHAEVNWVPRNLCVPVPDGVPPRSAAFSTVGAIALQGVRQANPQLGDTACVIGLGLVGQLVVQLLVASGVRVVGLDVVPARCTLAMQVGALMCASPDTEGLAAIESKISEVSGGLGADRIFLVAGGSSNSPVEVAARLARDRATIVDIGKCNLDLPWNAYYEKELDIRFSRSYGPGRYDARYELEGVDYPAGYVRWTERRNLQCFLDLVAARKIDPTPLISGSYPLGEATTVYEGLHAGSLQGIGFLLHCADYSELGTETASVGAAGSANLDAPKPSRATRSPVMSRPVRLAFIGAGNYASSMLLPHLSGQPEVELARVVTNRSLSAVNAQRKFGFTSTSTDVDSILSDDNVDGVFIVTRHSSHADLVCRALEAGKYVFVEKPLALTNESLDRILETVEATGNDRVMVGFNRRFSPLLSEMRDRLRPSSEPMMARYLVSAGSLSADSWYSNESLEGSRFAGEGGHFIDTLSWWIGDEPAEVSAVSVSDQDYLNVTLRYPDGSLGTVTYITRGSARFPKETLDAFRGMQSARLDNFRRATVWTGRRRHVKRSFASPDKGQRGELQAFLDAVRTAAPTPIPLKSLVATTRATLAVSHSLASGLPEKI
jgi:predicted dehydrogenase/threonine dehydrogenase-like Zn-dependent dehydrogenase